MGIAQGVFITQYYNQNNLDYSQFGLQFHGGIDIAAPKGTPVKACADGYIIERTDKPTGFGLRVSQAIPMGDKVWVLVYGHFDRFEVNSEILWNFNRKDTFVKEGDVIGYVDSTGFSTGHHLHFGLYEYDLNGNKLNPNNGGGGAIDPLPHMKIRLPKRVKYRKHPEEDILIRFPDLETQKRILELPEIKEIFQFDDYTYTLPLDKPPFPDA